MTIHTLWHVAVLGSTLFAAAGVMVLLLGSLVFDDPPPGLGRARPAVATSAILASALLALEWLGIH